ncbi:TPA: hypothetical protein NV830_001163 [Escherichia coli]|nr:hypothetical protein [Escherichia coli]HCJ8922379.1 hypothetical protein [Escherichia coli]
MKQIINSRNFSHWDFLNTGSGTTMVVPDGRLRMQNPDDSSRAMVIRDIMLMPGDTVTIYGIGRTTSLSSGAFIMGVEYPVGKRLAQANFIHNEDSLLLKCSWKCPVDAEPCTVRLACGLPKSTTAIAYMTDLWIEIDSENLSSRRILMDGVLEINAGVASISTAYDRCNVGSINASSVNVDISPAVFTAGDRRPLAFVQPIFNTKETYSSGVLIPVADFTKAGVLNIRLQNPATGNLVGVTGASIYKTIAFTVYI